MFQGCANLVNVDLSNFDTSEITNMDYMFCACYSLTDVDLSNFDTGNVTSMRHMFDNCNSLTNLDLSGFDTSNVISMDNMFSNCSNLISLDLSSFNTSNVTYMYQMFYFCKNLISLDLSNFNTSNVDSSLALMFQGCDSLVSLDLSNFDTSQVTSMYAMLDCNNLTTIYTPLNVHETVALPAKSGDIWYKSDGTEVTELPQNLSYSIVLGKNYIPEDLGTELDGVTIDKVEIASNVKVSKDKSAVQIVDAKTGEPVAGVRVWVGGEYWTDGNGIVELSNTGLTTIQIEKDGYHKKTAKKRLEKGEPALILLCPDTGDVEILTAVLNLAGEDGDVLNDTAYLTHRNLEEWEGNSASFTLTVESAGSPAKYQLIQNGKILQESTEGIFNLTGKYANHNDGSVSYYVDAFDAGHRVYVRVFDGNGKYKTQELGIRVSEESSVTLKIKEQNSKGEVDFGNDSLTVTIPSSIPIVGGSELNFGFNEKLPVAVNIDNSGKVRIALNMGDFDTSDSAGWYDKKQEFKNLANRAESLWNSAATFGGTPSSFGAGMFSAKASVVGYGEGYLDDSSDRLCVDVGVIMSIGGEAKYTQYYFLAYIPVYITFGGGITGTATGEISLSYKKNELLINGGSLEREISPYLNLEGGVGADNILSIGAYGKLIFTWLHRYTNNYDRATLSGNGKIKATAFLWSKVLAEADFFNLVIYDDNNQRSRAYADRTDTYTASWLDMSGAGLIPMDYLSKRAGSAGVSPFSMARAFDSPSQRFLSYAYENASPRLVQVGNKLCMFYLDGVEGRSAQNQTALFYQYSTDNGKTWSKAVRVDNGANETADYDFDVAVNGNNIYVIWSDAGKVYGDEIVSMDSAEAIAQVGKETDLMLAVINSSTGSITTRTIATENADLQPQIAIGSNGTVYVAWIMNDISSEEGIFSNENQMSICYASSTENYTVHSAALSSKYYPLALDVGVLGTEVYAATDIDMDGNLNTQEDREIYTMNLNTGGSLSVQTSNSVTDSVPLFAKIAGKNCLFWYQGGNIAYTMDGQTVDFIFAEDNLPVIGQEFSVLEGSNGNAAIIWTATSLTEDVGVDMYCADFDGSTWSGAYKLDELDSEYTTSVSGYLDGSDYRMAYLGSTYEDEELYSHIWLCTPEERIETSVVWYAEKDGAEGEEYPIHLLITNNGNVPVSTLSVFSEDGSIQDTITGLSIAPGASYELTWSGITLPVGMTDIYKCNLTVAAQGETVSDSNKVDISVGEPDFSIEAYQDYSNGELFAGIIVTNNGILLSDALLTVYSDKAHTDVLHQTSLTDIAGGESELAIFDLTVLDKTARTFYFVISDGNGMELYSGNNEAVLYVGKGIYSENNDNNSDDDDNNNNGDDNTTDDDNTGTNGSGNTSTGDSGNGNTENSGSDAWTRGESSTTGYASNGKIVDLEFWKPTTPDEKKRYACMGKETVQYTLAKSNDYRLIIENAMQGPLCFDSFEAVLGNYTIGRTYNVYTYPDRVYSMDKEVEFTIKIPKAIYKPDRKYKMICVTKDGLPIIYEDLDNNSETITVRSNKFYAYALIYRD